MKRLFRTFAFWLLLAAVLLTSGCILVPGFRRAAFGLADALVKIPGAITRKVVAATSSSVAPRSSDAVIASVQGIYTPVRDDYNEIANSAIEFTREMLAGIDENLFGNRRLVKYLEDNGEVFFNDGVEAWQITQAGTVYTVAGSENVAGVWYPTIYITFTQEGEHLFGEVVAIDTPEDSNSPTYRIVFDNADVDFQGAMTTELEAVNLNYNNLDTFNIPTKLWLRAYAQGEVFQIAASVYYTEVNLEDDQEIQPYLMAIMKGPAAPYALDELGITGLYQYRGVFQVNAEVDRGTIDLALVPGYTTPTGTEFADYSVGALWKEAIAAWIVDPELAMANDGVTQGEEVRTFINDFHFSLNLAVAETWYPIGTGSLEAEVFDALAFIQTNLPDTDPARGELDNLLFVVLLTNPAYFDN
ncbi:MAG: hypothetical protein V3S41_02440, partial [Spirochaetia bacterium]